MDDWLKLDSYDTEFSADSVEWCPHEPNQGLFVCGTYQLKENETENHFQKRVGRLLLFSTEDSLLKCRQTIETAAILDMKWCQFQIESKSIIAVADGLGQVHIYELSSELLQLTVITTIKVLNNTENSELLCLSVDWSAGKIEDSNPKLIVSDSTGHVSIYVYKNQNLVLELNWRSHDFDAWICAFNYWDTNQVVTGGDDALMKIYDLREQSTKPVLTKKCHEAGVTSLHFNKHQEHIFTSGSYDENVYIWDNRTMKTPLSVTKTSGGVWRLKWDPFASNYILAACMYGSFHVLSNQQSPEIVATYSQHKSICYGADWCYSKAQGLILATCSFYDHLLTLSKFNPDNDNKS